jgi:nucleotide-binding universal stress UspA family protein
MPAAPAHIATRPQPRDVERDWPSRPAAPIKQPVIILATSGSRSSERATVYAAQLAASLNAPLRIVHVLPAIEYRVGRLAPMRGVQHHATDPFDSPVLCRARELAWHHGSAATLQLLAGDISKTIVAAATDTHADLLVLSTPRAHRRFVNPAPLRRWIEQHAPCQITTPGSRIPADSLQLGSNPND